MLRQNKVSQKAGEHLRNQIKMLVGDGQGNFGQNISLIFEYI